MSDANRAFWQRLATLRMAQTFRLMSATAVYRLLIAIRIGWTFVEWLFSWGPYSHVTLLTLLHPYASLIPECIAVALWLVILAGLWFFQRWARTTFVLLIVLALLTLPFRVQRYSFSPPPSFVPVVAIFMLFLTVAIIAMSFLPPVRECFATDEA